MPVACRRCRQLKVKCLLSPDHKDGQPCQRCVRASLDCAFDNHQRGRKPGFRLTDRSRALSRLKSAYRVLHAQETDSRDLLASSGAGPSSRRNSQQFHLQSSFRPHPFIGSSQPPAHASFLPTYSDMEPSHRSPSSLREFFASICGEAMGEPVEALDLYRQDPVACGYMSEEVARQLFEDFHKRIGPAIELLDPLLHTHDWVRNRSQFLYTTIIAVALKFSHDPDIVLLGRCQALAQDQLLRTFVDGLSSVESAQALLLLTEYKEPEDKSMYLLVGLACRIGMDLGLGNTPTGGNERMNRNYTRTWLALFCADQRFSIASQVSKSAIMQEDATIRKSAVFHHSSLRTAHDVALAGGVQLRRLWRQYSALIEACSTSLASLYSEFSQAISEWEALWVSEVLHTGQNTDSFPTFLRLNALHAELTIAHIWLYSEYKDDFEAEDETNRQKRRLGALFTCIDLATRMYTSIINTPRATLSYLPDSFHMFMVYATTFVTKAVKSGLLGPDVIGHANAQWIATLIPRTATVLRDAAISPRHTIALHADAVDALGRLLEQEALRIQTILPFDQPTEYWEDLPGPSEDQTFSVPTEDFLRNVEWTDFDWSGLQLDAWPTAEMSDEYRAFGFTQ